MDEKLSTTKKIIIGTAISLSVVTGVGYVATEQDVKDLESQIEKVSYIRAKKIIDERQQVIDISSVIGSSTIISIKVNGQEFLRK